MTAIASCSRQGRSPAHISSTTQPTLQMSTFALYPRLVVLTTSGAIQKTVPCIAVSTFCSLTLSVLLEIPKSEILQIPLCSTRMLSAFRSWFNLARQRRTFLERMEKVTHSVKDTLGMEIFQATENLRGEGLGNIIVEPAILPQATPNGATRNILQETITQPVRQPTPKREKGNTRLTC